MLTFIGLVGVWFFGNATWIAALVNFLWLLVKDQSLFSWWFVVGSAIAAVLSIIAVFIGVVED